MPAGLLELIGLALREEAGSSRANDSRTYATAPQLEYVAKLPDFVQITAVRLRILLLPTIQTGAGLIPFLQTM